MRKVPPPLAQLNQFPQRAERLIPFGATHQAPMPSAPRAVVQAPPMGGIRSLAPRFAAPQAFHPMTAPRPMAFPR